jgi:hypothetical protein
MKALMVAAMAAGVFLPSGAAHATQTVRGWMAFAIDRNGAVGHGAADSLDDARRYAVRNCRGSSCEVVAQTSALCTALAHTPHVISRYKYATYNGIDLSTVKAGARNSCERRGGLGCIVAYSYCQPRRGPSRN